jgi:hypothetical protein
MMDTSDKFDRVAFMLCSFICDQCGVWLDSPDPNDFTSIEFHKLGQKAKGDGWYVNEDIDGSLPTVLCPKCRPSS